jgi:hypothetical protein
MAGVSTTTTTTTTTKTTAVYVPTSVQLSLAVDEAKSLAEDEKVKALAIQLDKDIQFLADEWKRLIAEYPTGNSNASQVASEPYRLQMARSATPDSSSGSSKGVIKAVWKLYVPWHNLSAACSSYQKLLDSNLNISFIEQWKKENAPPCTTVFFTLFQ